MLKSFRLLSTILVLVISTQVYAGTPREVTKTSQIKMDINQEIRNFVENMIEQDKNLQAQISKLRTKAGSDEAYGTGDYQITEWKINRVAEDILEKKETFKIESDKIFLVTQILYDSYPGTYSANEHLVFKIRVQNTETLKRSDDNSALFVEETLSLKLDKVLKLKSSWLD